MTTPFTRGQLEALRDFDTALLANTLGYVDPVPADEIYMGAEIRSATPALGPTCGVAFTCQLDSSTPDNVGDIEPFWQQLAEMQALALPVIWVVQTTGSLSIYDDRLEIISPGRLPHGITPERMLTGCRAARNQLIKDVMRDYRYLEHSGMGVTEENCKDYEGS